MRYVTHDDHRLRDAMTVEELIDELQQLPPDAKVLFACSYWDHGDTIQVLPAATIDELSSDEALTESPYSRSGISLEKASSDASDEKLEQYEAASEHTNVVIMR